MKIIRIFKSIFLKHFIMMFIDNKRGVKYQEYNFHLINQIEINIENVKESHFYSHSFRTK